MRSALAAFLLATALAPAAAAATAVDSNTFGGLTARSIGPAVMSGRIAAIDAVGPDPLTIYVGAAGGGVWRSTDAGVTWKAVFDDYTQSIGAIAIDRAHPDTVWVGTGESWTRNSVSVGTGLYKTTDGGKTWELSGLADSERIAKVVVDPHASDTVFACATGHLWNANEERGVYKTTDGGKSWKRVLYVDADTGCADLDVDPQDPRILYAGMWQFRRFPDFFQSGGPGSGLYRSTDGGDSWSELKAGLPPGEKGRIAVAVAPSRPSVVYAVVEAKEKNALFRSDDLGESWREVNASTNVQIRPFYFGRLVVDPTDFNRLYKPGFTLGISEDGGKSVSSPFTGGIFGAVHPDNHALWVNPDNPQELLVGTDGGVYHSFDRGGTWSFVGALPVAQYYHVSYDMDRPYNVYGGLQDNSCWMGPSESIGGIENRDWLSIGGGDGFYAYRDPADSGYVYSEFQGGEIARTRLATMEARDIKPTPGPGEPDYRFNWNTPIALSPNEPGTIYIGAQFLFRSRDHGASWERLSPDLTTNDPAGQRQMLSGGLTIDNSAAENYTTIYSISESPRDGKVIWVGTDDGNVQLTRDGGASWTNVVGNVGGLPPRTWVSTVAASPHDAATAFVTFDGHRRGDMATYVYRTTDYGASWQSLATADLAGYAHVIRQDPVDPDLLFLGTEFGLYVSIDGGAGWARFTGNLPQVAVRDIAIQPRENDLILATHGRGIYIVDDITPLRQLSAEVADADVFVFASPPVELRTTGFSFGFPGHGEFVGDNPPEAATITYYLKRRHLFGDLKAEVYDAGGKLLATIPGTKRRGINRILWPMRARPPKAPPTTNLSPPALGPRVPEGTYSVKLIKAKDTYTTSIELVADPDSPHSAADRAAEQQLVWRLYDMLGRLTYLVDSAIDLRDQATTRAAALPAGDRLRGSLEELGKAFDAYQGQLVATSKAGWLSGEERLREKLAALYGAVNSYDGRPTQTQAARADTLGGELTAAGERFDALVAGDLARVNRALERKGLAPLTLKSRQQWEAEQEGS
jgi:photosystem II stability/assembly factor-like uncharacterized protein